MSKRQRSDSLNKQLSNSIPQAYEKQEISNKFALSQLLQPKIHDFSKCKITEEKSLPRQYFRQDVVTLAKELLGKIFIRNTQKGIIKAVIVQTQAYKAPLDKACHAYNNKKTERTKYFWLDGGHLYLYTIYMPTNICLNVVAGLQGEPEAVLIRAVQPIQGIQLVKQMRNIKSPKFQDVSNGPGKCGQALGIDLKQMNGISLLDGQFRIVDGGIKGFTMGISRRVNIDYAEEWIDKPWRFFVQGNKFVSKVNFKDPVVKPNKKSKKQ